MRSHRFLMIAAAIFSALSASAQNVSGYGPPLKDTPEHVAHVAAMEARMRQAERMLSQAKGSVKKGDFAKAVSLLQQTLAAFPLDEARLLLTDIYIRWNRPADVLQTLQPIVCPPINVSSSVGLEVTTRMKYVLALLDTGKWTEAATVYEQSVNRQGEPLMWSIPGYGVNFALKEHTLPDAHFSPDLPDKPGLRAQAHLILGSRMPQHVDPTIDQQKHLEYMLDHLQQAIKSDRRNLDAHFFSGVLLGQLERFAEARAEFAQTAKLAPREAQPEIKAALDNMNRYEASKKLYEATHPANADASSSAIGVKATLSKTSDHTDAQGAQNGRAF